MYYTLSDLMDLSVFYLLVGIIIIIAFLYLVYDFLKKIVEKEKKSK
jgi:hypothetical protein